MSERITIGPHTYEINEARDTIKRYDEKYKMWVTVKFNTDEVSAKKAEAELIRTLTNEYLKQYENR